MQLLSVIRWKLELAIFSFTLGSCSTMPTLQKKYNKLVDTDVTLSLKVRYYWEEIQKQKYIFPLARVCK